MTRLLVAATLVALSLIACSPSPVPEPSSSPSASTSSSPRPSASISPTPSASAPAGTCAATDQDRFIYHPDRLLVKAACIRITGVVLAEVHEADGDLHIRVKLDPSFQSLLTPANQNQCAQGQCGLLVVEPVCVDSPTQSDAISTCQSDPDPLRSLPPVNAHVWLEGRYVLDQDHGGWAELHPLYRWGPA